jgi:hypothetical protein
MMTRTQKARLLPLLEAFYNMPHRHRIQNDPIVIPRRHTDPLDIETVGWLVMETGCGTLTEAGRLQNRDGGTMSSAVQRLVSRSEREWALKSQMEGLRSRLESKVGILEA